MFGKTIKTIKVLLLFNFEGLQHNIKLMRWKYAGLGNMFFLNNSNELQYYREAHFWLQNSMSKNHHIINNDNHTQSSSCICPLFLLSLFYVLHYSSPFHCYLNTAALWMPHIDSTATSLCRKNQPGTYLQHKFDASVTMYLSCRANLFQMNCSISPCIHFIETRGIFLYTIQVFYGNIKSRTAFILSHTPEASSKNLLQQLI